MRAKRNIVGGEVQRIRLAKKLSQDDLSARCMLLGFDASRSSISHIETGYRGVSDLEMVLLSQALRCDINDLIPKTVPLWKKDSRAPKGEGE